MEGLEKKLKDKGGKLRHSLGDKDNKGVRQDILGGIRTEVEGQGGKPIHSWRD